MDHDVFISYRRKRDSAWADKVRTLLEQRGFDAWMDRDDLPPGKPYAPRLNRALNSARCVVVIWSRASVDSKWVNYEAKRGMERNRLVSLSLDGTRPPAGLSGPVIDALAPDWQMLLLDEVRIVHDPMPDVLIAATHEDRLRLAEIDSALSDPAWTLCWLDSLKDDHDRFLRVLNKAKCVIPIWSEKSKDIAEIHQAAKVAFKKGRCVPVILDNANPPNDVAPCHGISGDGTTLEKQLLKEIHSRIAAPPGSGWRLMLVIAFLILVSCVFLILAYTKYGSDSWMADFGLGLDEDLNCSAAGRQPFWWLEGLRSFLLLLAAGWLVARVFSRETLWLFGQWRPPAGVRLLVRQVRFFLAVGCLVVSACVIYYHLYPAPKKLASKAKELARRSEDLPEFHVKYPPENIDHEYYRPYRTYMAYALVNYAVVGYPMAMVVCLATLCDLRFIRRRRVRYLIEAGIPPFKTDTEPDGESYACRYEEALFSIYERYPAVPFLIALYLVVESFAIITLADAAANLVFVAIAVFFCFLGGLVFMYYRYRSVLETARIYVPLHNLSRFNLSHGFITFLRSVANRRGEVLLGTLILMAVAILGFLINWARAIFLCRS